MFFEKIKKKKDNKTINTPHNKKHKKRKKFMNSLATLPSSPCGSRGLLSAAASTSYHQHKHIRRHQKVSSLVLQRIKVGGGKKSSSSPTTTRAAGEPASSINETLELTGDNVEKVLDEVRPYLISDGGNVELVEIDGLVVKLRLQGACGSCPSSTVTMRMGIERLDGKNPRDSGSHATRGRGGRIIIDGGKHRSNFR